MINKVWPCGYSKKESDDCHRLIKHKNNEKMYRDCVAEDAQATHDSEQDNQHDSIEQVRASQDSDSVTDVTDVTGVTDIKTPLPTVTACPLDEVREWWGTYILPTSQDDLDLLALWTIHTHLTEEVRSTPRLIISSIEPMSGKTTVLEHMTALAYRPEKVTGKSTPALLGRLTDLRSTLMIDEADKSLRSNDPASNDVFEILNTGYKKGGRRPVLVPSANGDWDVKSMSTFSPAIITGNNPYLPEDTRSRSITIVLLKDVAGQVEDTDWFDLEEPAAALKAKIEAWADSVREQAEQAKPVFPDGFVGRIKEIWRGLFIVADLAGGDWPKKVRDMATAYRDDLQADLEAGYTGKSKDRHILEDIHAVWGDEDFLPTETIVSRLKSYNGYYSPDDGKPLTTHRLGIAMRGLKIKSDLQRHDGKPSRGYWRSAFVPAWTTFGLTGPGGVSISVTPVTPVTSVTGDTNKPSDESTNDEPLDADWATNANGQGW